MGSQGTESEPENKGGGGAASFHGTDRFELKRRLGEGSMGAVYLAYDIERGADVALKTLRRVDAAGIYRFKREFRALSDVVHPNLVVLHDLFHANREWFFTMEYVEGKDFLSYVLGSRRDTFEPTPKPTPDAYDSADLRSSDSGEMFARGLEMLFPTPLRDEERLRGVLIQIAHGLLAIHAAGKLHRDLKSDNVLVTASGQAKVLDFGIVIERAASPHGTLEIGVMGTPAYMSPEQAAGRPVNEATDWYALGVMIYEALTGTMPFDGTYLQVMQQKQDLDPIPPSDVVSGIPSDLDELCVQLLQRSPSARPHGLSVLRALERRRRPSVRPPTSSVPVEPDAPFVGRIEQLAALRRHLGLTDRARPVVTLVHGPSGIGKTTLVDRFVTEQRLAERAVVLKGRCYERELVPFKAFDTLIDALSRYLRRLPSVQAAETLPRNILALAQLFPVLRRVEVVANARRRAQLPPDPQELRRRAFAALKELLSRIADRKPLILFIDDLQWGDVDSAHLIGELLRGPDAPAILLVLTYRSGDVTTSPCLQTVFEQFHDNADAELHDIPLEPLSEEESRELARQLLGVDVPTAIASVGRECQGNPHLLTELVRHVLDAQESGSASLDTREGRISFERALLKRVGELSAGARTLLELVSVAGRPVAEEVLVLVSTFNIDLQDALVELRGAKLIRGVGTHERRAIETYHDRIREAVVGAMTPDDLTRWHRRLATTLEASGSDDLEAVTEHLVGARDSRRAQIYAIRAAIQAADALAFEKAARLFAIAVQHEEDEAWGYELLVRWADSLLNAGRAAQAASVFFEAMRSAPESEIPGLKRRAGAQLLLSGQRAQALSLLEDRIVTLGIVAPADHAHAAERLAAAQAQLRQRGLSFAPKDEASVSSEDLATLDLHWSIALGVWLTTPGEPQSLVADHLLSALDKGEPFRALRALCAYHAAVELRQSTLAGAVPLGALRAARELQRAVADEERASAWLLFAEGHEALGEGKYKAAVSAFSRAEELFRTRCAGSATEMRMCRVALSLLWVTFVQFERMTRVDQWTAEAEEHEDLFSATRLRLLTALSALCGGEPDRAERRIAQALSRLGAPPDSLTEYIAGVVQAYCELYRGDAATCREGTGRVGGLLDKPPSELPLLRAQLLCLRARLRLGAHSAGDGEAEERVTADLSELAALRVPVLDSQAILLRAELERRRGNLALSLSLLERVISGASESPDGGLLVACAQRLKGRVIGEEEGRLLIARADASWIEHGAADPATCSRLYLPDSQ